VARDQKSTTILMLSLSKTTLCSSVNIKIDTLLQSLLNPPLKTVLAMDHVVDIQNYAKR
jgi:hypothetical protein